MHSNFASEHRAEEIQQLLDKPVEGLLKWGISCVFLIVIFIVTSTWFIPYPNIILTSFELERIDACSFTIPQKAVNFKPILANALYKDNYYGKIVLTRQAVGDFKLGQPVKIKFHKTSYQKLGFVQGRVIGVSETLHPPYNISIRFRLPNDFKTLDGRYLTLIPGLTGTAELTLDDKRLFQRIFSFN